MRREDARRCDIHRKVQEKATEFLEQHHAFSKKDAGGGHGKTTAGYASMVIRNDHFIIAKLLRQQAVKNGVVRHFADDVEKVRAARRVYLPNEPFPLDNQLPSPS
jgi:hypothetical protein